DQKIIDVDLCNRLVVPHQFDGSHGSIFIGAARSIERVESGRKCTERKCPRQSDLAQDMDFYCADIPQSHLKKGVGVGPGKTGIKLGYAVFDDVCGGLDGLLRDWDRPDIVQEYKAIRIDGGFIILLRLPVDVYKDHVARA